MPGYMLDTAAVNKFLFFVSSRITKSGGIRLEQHPVATQGKTFLNIDDLVYLERQVRTNFTAGSVIAVHVLVCNARFTDSLIFALSYWNTSICLFGKNIDDNSGGNGQVTRSNLLSALLQHEFGHLMGLVGQGSALQSSHRDFSNGAHCNNPDCLMFYGVETASNLGMPNHIPSLDTNCINDLKANGGK